jgi:hypothetical protein
MDWSNETCKYGETTVFKNVIRVHLVDCWAHQVPDRITLSIDGEPIPLLLITQGKPKACLLCGSVAHQQRDCLDKVCRYCHEYGHLVTDCEKTAEKEERRRQREIAARLADEDREAELLQITLLEENAPTESEPAVAEGAAGALPAQAETEEPRDETADVTAEKNDEKTEKSEKDEESDDESEDESENEEGSGTEEVSSLNSHPLVIDESVSPPPAQPNQPVRSTPQDYVGDVYLQSQDQDWEDMDIEAASWKRQLEVDEPEDPESKRPPTN